LGKRWLHARARGVLEVWLMPTDAGEPRGMEMLVRFPRSRRACESREQRATYIPGVVCFADSPPKPHIEGREPFDGVMTITPWSSVRPCQAA
jgi:hypothetical protein